ncbi:MAG TPA: iron ABC transporter permease [Anaeromyxobacteraceae bacterium]|nr:iron ABC transporter permease [Anaeromyxobacteraceae bacterium]
MNRGRVAVMVLAGLAALAAALVLACMVGAQPVSFARAIAGQDPDRTILFGLRLPRALVGALVGCALAAAGTALQALLRNPLAEPFVLGVSGGAALGGTLVLVATGAASHLLGFSSTALGLAPSVATGAVVGAAGATLLVFALGRESGRLVPEAALLVGVVFNFFAAAMITLAKLLVPPDQALRLIYWLTGAISYEGGVTLVVGVLCVGVSVAALVLLSGRMNLLSLGEEEAASLGLHVGLSRGLVLLAASAATGAAVTLAGMVGFVGLIVPHAARRVLGPDHRVLVPAAALFGAAFLVISDAVARVAFLLLGTEPPVGALTAFIGGPLFLWLMRRSRRPG